MADETAVVVENSVIIIGSRSVGKTTMVYKFLDKDEIPKPTTAMDYSFGRKGGKSLVKDVIHVWEVGHLTSSLIAAAITGANSINSASPPTLIIMLDLSSPETLWSVLEESLTVSLNAVKMTYEPEIIDEMKSQKMKDLQQDTEISNQVTDPFPLRLCFIGGKYDLFQNFDLATKQLVGRTLRGVAYIHGADLQYYSSKDRILIKKMKDLLSYYGFNTHAVKGLCSDYDKALVIPAGTDSFSNIDREYPGALLIADAVKHAYLSKYSYDPKYNEFELEDPSNDPNFNENIIDRIRSQREEEIAVNLHQMMEGQLPKMIVADPY